MIKLFRYKNVSDFRKEKLILNYSKKLFIVSIKIIAIITFIYFFLVIINLFSNSYFDLILSILGVIELSIIFTIYHLIRKKFNAKL